MGGLASLIIPIYNEEKYIRNCVESILEQDYENKEILFIDGGSKDATVKILREYPVIILKNLKKFIAPALNIGIKIAHGKYIVRMDAHAKYARDYVSKSIEILEKTGAKNVGGPMIAHGNTLFQKANAAAYCSRFALGGGSHHDENFEGFAETVNYGTFSADFIKKLTFDENLILNEDDDLNLRIHELGGKVYVSPKIKFIYYPRKDFSGLWRQYFGYGLWKPAVVKKHGRLVSIRHIIPPLFVIYIFLMPFIPNFFNIFGILYLILDLFFSFTNKKANCFAEKTMIFLIHFVMHFSYGIGFICGIFKFLGKKFENFKSIELNKNQIQKLQLKSLEIFDYFNEFCSKNALTFFMCGGACIGAVRENAFIPWDDDIDVFMPRPDYEKLTKIWKDTKDFEFERTNFIRIYDKNSILFRRENISKTPRGIALDVFPIDGCPSTELTRKIQFANAMIFSLFASNTTPEKHGVFIKFCCKILLKIIPKNAKRYIAGKCEENMAKYDIKKCCFVVELCAGPRYAKNKYPKKAFDSVILKEFEGRAVPLPYDYDVYLRAAFDDYVVPPPPEERKPHHDVVYFEV
jgi:lipopolysaccharide cholinephosphotransferase